MQPSDAIKLAARLKSAYPRMTLDEEEGEMFVSQLALLADPLILNQAIDRIIRTSERFPSIAEVRAQYRACNEAGRKPPALPAGPRDEIPEWVHVWRWHMNSTRTERQAAREGTRQKVEDRAPAKMRDFPQYQHPGPDAYTLPEYEEIRADWVAHGSPKVGSVEDAIAV